MCEALDHRRGQGMVGRPPVELIRGARVKAHGRDADLLQARVSSIDLMALPALSPERSFTVTGTPLWSRHLHHGGGHRRRLVRIAQQRRPGARPHYLAHGTAHVDVDDVGDPLTGEHGLGRPSMASGVSPNSCTATGRSSSSKARYYPVRTL